MSLKITAIFGCLNWTKWCNVWDDWWSGIDETLELYIKNYKGNFKDIENLLSKDILTHLLIIQINSFIVAKIDGSENKG